MYVNINIHFEISQRYKTLSNRIKSTNSHKTQSANVIINHMTWFRGFLGFFNDCYLLHNFSLIKIKRNNECKENGKKYLFTFT